MGTFIDFLKELNKASIEIETSPKPPKIINNYYVFKDERAINVSETEFNEMVRRKQISHSRKLIR